MKGTKYMKIFKIIDEENDLLSGVLLYYEKSRTAIIELPEYLDEWNAPLLFTGYIKKKIYTIPRDMSFCWIKERVIPSGRQNIGDILNTHHLKSYDEMQFLEISDGRCSQDSLYIRKTDEVPMFVEERQQRNLKECVIVGNGRLLCFFYDGCVKKVDIATLDNVDADDIAKVIRHKGLYESGQIGLVDIILHSTIPSTFRHGHYMGRKKRCHLHLRISRNLLKKICWIQRKYAILWNVADKIFLI